jgi:uncharacterized protein YeeX (DUF496 family)
LRGFDDAWRTADAVGAVGHVALAGGGLMHISYVKLFRDDEGIVRDTQEANGEIRNFQHQIELLKHALEREMNTVTDLRELLNTVRRIAYELNEEILKDQDAKTEE